MDRSKGWSRNRVFLLVSRLRRVLFQGGPLLPARLNLSRVEGRVSGKRTRPRRLESLEAQRLEIRLTTPSLQASHHSGFPYNAYGTKAGLLAGYLSQTVCSSRIWARDQPSGCEPIRQLSQVMSLSDDLPSELFSFSGIFPVNP